MGTPLLAVEGLSASYADRRRGPSAPAVDDVDLAVDPGDFFTLLGPSGCGKTTLLRCVAGLHEPQTGRITIDGRVVHDRAAGIDVPPNRRRVGMVFQSHAIWPHLDVFANAAFPLTSARRSVRRSGEEIRRRVAEVLDIVGLGELADRPASRLSGGQQQRLALARAVVAEPDLLLLDEPLSNLDAPLRVTMRLELKRLQRELGLTVLFVTHDQDEALSVSTAVGVMHDGRLVQVGTPAEIYDRPADPFVASFVGRANVLPGAIDRGRVQTAALGPIEVVPAAQGPEGNDVSAVIRPERVELRPSGGGQEPNCWRGVVREVSFRGDVVDVALVVGEVSIEARVAHDPTRALVPGAEVWIHLPPAAVRVVPDQRSGS